MEEIENRQKEIYGVIVKLLENFKKSPKDRLTKAYLETRLETLESYWSKFQKYHDSLAVASAEKRLELSYFTTNMSDTCLETYLELKTAIKEKAAALHDKVKLAPKEMPANPTLQNPICKVKLPPIQIPKFSGEYKDWT